MGMFDTQAEGLNKTAEEKAAAAKNEGGGDLADMAALEQFNQHILLTAQAINRLRANLFGG